MMNEELPAEAQNKIVVFGAKRIRRTWHEEQWFFSVVDIVGALTDSADPKQYIKKMRQRDPQLDSYWGTICTPLDLPAPDGKVRKSNCASVLQDRGRLGVWSTGGTPKRSLSVSSWPTERFHGSTVKRVWPCHPD